MIELYPWNQNAYDAVVEQFSLSDRACVIQPCGTGKSWIAFKLIEDNPSKKFLWMSPSKYIFDEQLHNAMTTAGSSFDNLDQMTYTYAALKAESDESIGTNYDYIILDEFHHLGAEKWGLGVESIIEANPDIKILGLSATEVRTDGRDMADEMFKDAVVHRMTLQEAMLTGILKLPKYIVADYMLEGEVKAIRKQIVESGKEDDEEVNDLYKLLQRSLQHASNVPEVLSKYIAASGKIVVFCRDKQHLASLVELANDWFGLVNDRIHTYQTFSDNPAADAEYQSFKADTSSALKVLYCINQLNEGMHIRDIDAVVMCRPTQSMIVYTQQMGRALEAGSADEPLVVDLVDNLENAGLGVKFFESLKQEAKQRRERGEKTIDEIDSYSVIDLVQTPRELLDKLDDLFCDKATKIDRQIKKLIELIELKKVNPQEFGTSGNDSQRRNSRKYSDIAHFIRVCYKSGKLTSEQIDLLKLAEFDYDGKHKVIHLLKDVYPELFSQLDPDRNGDLEKITSNRKQKLVWRHWSERDHCYHHWTMTVSKVLQGQGCAVCAGRQVQPGVNDLYSVKPDMMKYVASLDVAKSVTVHSKSAQLTCICSKCGKTTVGTPTKFSQMFDHTGRIICDDCFKLERLARLNRIRTHAGRRRRVRCIETGEVFDSVTDAVKASKHVDSKDCKVQYGVICRSLSGAPGRYSAYGYHWEYVDDESESK